MQNIVFRYFSAVLFWIAVIEDFCKQENCKKTWKNDPVYLPCIKNLFGIYDSDKGT